MSPINKLYLWIAGFDLKTLVIIIMLVKLATGEDPDGPPTNP